MIDLLRDPHSLWREHVTAREMAFLERIEGFLEREVAPQADAWERGEAIPVRAFRRAGSVGLMGMLAPARAGGLGIGAVAYVLAIREVGRHQAAFAIDLAAHNALVVGHILRDGTPAQRKRALPRLISGQWLGAWALTEPEAGSDSAAVQTTAVSKSGGGWELTGCKKFITQGRRADIAIVIAASGTRQDGRKEISAFLVAKRGIKPVRKIPTSGLRASETSEIRFLRAPAELLGRRGGGQAAALACLDNGRIGVAAVSLGLARAALDAALAYSQVRRQFGQRLADFEAIQFMLADCEVELRAAELLTLQAALLEARGARHTRESAIAKLYATETASRICNRALQIHGGAGYCRDLPLERYWRDARFGEIGEGTSEIQRLVIARSLIGK